MHGKKENIFFDPYKCEFYYDMDYKLLPENVKKEMILLPDNEWRRAANDFVESFIHKKYRQRIKDNLYLQEFGFDSFWSEMEKYNMIWEWRSYYADFLFKKAEKWCLENNIHFTTKKNSPGDFFAT